MISGSSSRNQFVSIDRRILSAYQAYTTPKYFRKLLGCVKKLAKAALEMFFPRKNGTVDANEKVHSDLASVPGN